MPISKYFKGSGSKVMKKMKDEYGEEKGKEVFYATANKMGMTAEEHSKMVKKMKKRKMM